MNPEELANEMVVTRRAIAIHLRRLLVVEEKIAVYHRERTVLEGAQARRKTYVAINNGRTRSC